MPKESVRKARVNLKPNLATTHARFRMRVVADDTKLLERGKKINILCMKIPRSFHLILVNSRSAGKDFFLCFTHVKIFGEGREKIKFFAFLRLI
jgi:hypothetical protein